jgi:glutaredoxin-related protein
MRRIRLNPLIVDTRVREQQREFDVPKLVESLGIPALSCDVE